MMKILNTTVFLFLLFGISCINKNSSALENKLPEYNVTIPVGGNSWVNNSVDQSSNVISHDGIYNWSDPSQVIRTYFYVDKTGVIDIGINAKVISGTSLIKFSFGGESKKITLNNTELGTTYIGEFNINEVGYHYVDMQGLEKDGDKFADVKEFLLRVEGDSSAVKYVKDDFHFGRRGPSVHLSFVTPPEMDDIEWFYNEVEIPEGEDVLGSYFMADGFKEGYFGIQVNSPTERRILFSIWSPYKTDDPKSIPDEYKIILLKKGENVTSGEFGNEGSGGQSYKKYKWKTGVRYGFLIGAKPTGDNSTDYTAYFYDPEIGSWALIASFRRPMTSTYLKGLYSFLENFHENTGAISRKGTYFNQWVRDSSGSWHELNTARFTADLTARNKARLDFSGGLESGGFYLKNCGFTNDTLAIGTTFTLSEV